MIVSYIKDFCKCIKIPIGLFFSPGDIQRHPGHPSGGARKWKWGKGRFFGWVGVCGSGEACQNIHVHTERLAFCFVEYFLPNKQTLLSLIHIGSKNFKPCFSYPEIPKIHLIQGVYYDTSYDSSIVDLILLMWKYKIMYQF